LYSRIPRALRGIRTDAAGFREKSVNALIAESENEGREEAGEAYALGPLNLTLGFIE